MSEFQIKNHRFDALTVEPGLYIAATPIGNLGDITIRTLEILAGCDLIACEDTRVTSKLLRHFGIDKKTISYHEHNANVVGARIINDLLAEKSVVLVSDAGTPLVSDPGFRLVETARENNIPIFPLPGATAPVTALVASGLNAETFTFAGFLPTKQGARQKRLEELSDLPSTLIFFESPNRLAKSLYDMTIVLGNERKASVARELTKLHEEVLTQTLGELYESYEDKNPKGEIVILVEQQASKVIHDVDALLSELLQTMSVSKAAGEAAELTGGSKRDLYQRALVLKDNH